MGESPEHKAEVECYSGASYAERPTALIWEGQRLVIAEIERHWREPTGPAFHVHTLDGRRFEVRYDESKDRWSINVRRET